MGLRNKVVWEGDASMVAASTNRVAMKVRARLIEKLIFLLPVTRTAVRNFSHTDYCDLSKLPTPITRAWAESEQRGHVLCKIPQTKTAKLTHSCKEVGDPYQTKHKARAKRFDSRSRPKPCDAFSIRTDWLRFTLRKSYQSIATAARPLE